MSKFAAKNRHGPILWLAAMGLLLMALPVRADSGIMLARARTISSRLEAYAQVEPIAVLKLNAAAEGVVAGLKVLPGEPVEADTVLARLQGPAIEALLTQLRNAVASARAARVAAHRSFTSERQKNAQRLSTRQAVSKARAALAEARARFHNARSRLQAAQATVVLKAPAAGTVLTVNAAQGERVQPGQTILTIQPANALWLTARYYGSAAAAVRVGMSGRFVPAAGGSAIPVKVRSIIGAVGSDGGQPVGLVATVLSPNWRSGEAGTLILKGTPRTLVAVPTRALILDQGRWWVLVHSKGGNRRQAVIPGPSRGDSTLIERGLKPGTEVVVENAYLEFHREFSKHYQPPD